MIRPKVKKQQFRNIGSELDSLLKDAKPSDNRSELVNETIREIGKSIRV